MKKHFLIFGLCLAFVSCNKTKSENDDKITTIGASSINMPADQVIFNVKLTVSNKELNKVYEEYRALENKMVTLIEELNISKKSLSYSLLSVGKQPWRFPELLDPPLTAEQNITFVLDSVNLFSSVQTKLITYGFTEFNSNFTSTKIEDYKKQALEAAVLTAKKKAEILAGSGERKIKRISAISDFDDAQIYFADATESMSMKSGAAGSDKSLTHINQQITVSAKVKVVFELE